MQKDKEDKIKQIYEYIPQRPPFLMIDEIVSLDIKNKTIVCKKEIKKDEWYLKGHFPDKAIMPGVLIVEAMAQTSSVIGKIINNEDGIMLLTGIEECKFTGMATIGDVLEICAKVEKIKGSLLISDCYVKLNEKIIATAKIKAFKKLI